jgi:YidC/Oxa1 family membrane protein insertase
MDQQKRFLLALVLSGAVLVTWQSFFAPKPEDLANQEQSQTAKTAKNNKQGASADKPAQADKTPAADPSQAPAVPAKDVPVRTLTMASKAISIKLSNEGGTLRGFTILSPAQYQKAGDLFAGFPKDSKNFPLSLDFGKGSVTLPDKLVYEIDEAQSVKSGEGYSTIVMRHVEPSGKFSLEKRFSLDEKQPYLVNLHGLRHHRRSDGRRLLWL